jgi:hypothetical protein
MVRSISFALALMLSISGWSTAQAAPQSITPPREWFTGWKPKNFTKLHRATPLELGILGAVDEISLKALGWPFSFLGGSGACKYSSWLCSNDKNDRKDADRDRAY